jgi:hypothetical protein
MDTTILGTGTLNWRSAERHLDRYGTIHLATATATTGTGTGRAYATFDDAPVGTRGRLVAVVLAARPPFRPDTLAGRLGLDPGGAPPGAEITLGTGTLFVETSPYGNTEIGLRPDDGRTERWLDATALVGCADQPVRLELHPDRQV